MPGSQVTVGKGKPVFKFKIIPDGAHSFEVEATSRDVLKWERQGPKRSIKDIAETMRFSDLYPLAHIACQRLGTWGSDLSTAQFMTGADLEIVTPDEDDEEGDEGFPTGEGR